MKRKRRNKNQRLVIRWTTALAAALVLLIVLAIAFRGCSSRRLPPSNPYTTGDFAYNGAYLTCLAGESHLCIDVSSHQGSIDWRQVKAAGIDYAIIRLGYRGYETGLLHEDETARINLKGAAEAGLKIGAYFFSQALTEAEAREEARLALDILDGRTLDLPLAYDWEYVSQSARTGQMDRQTLTGCVQAFCETVLEAGYQPMLYFNQDLADTLLDVTRFVAYPYWFAGYSGEMTCPYKLKFWQYTDKGVVPGIEGDVDINLYFP